MSKLLTTIIVWFLVPQMAFAEGVVTRRDGFLQIWSGIRRMAEETREEPFADVHEGAPGFREITYAKNRGILDGDDSRFHPDYALTLSDALLWLFRSRNVDELDRMRVEDLPVLLEKYVLWGRDISAPQNGNIPDGDISVPRNVSPDELTELIARLDQLLRDEVHEVSLYAEDFHGDGTAFGETFDMYALTAAHRTLPWNTLVKVTNVENGKSVTVRINDRGPFVPGRDMDLSLGAFTAIAERSKGKIMARFERLGDARIVGPCGGGENRFQRRLSRTVHFTRGVPHTLPLSETLVLAANKPFVMRGVRYPDGTSVRLQDFVHPGERYAFTPSIEGEYVFRIGTVEGRVRAMRMKVVHCPVSAGTGQ